MMQWKKTQTEEKNHKKQVDKTHCNNKRSR